MRAKITPRRKSRFLKPMALASCALPKKRNYHVASPRTAALKSGLRTVLQPTAGRFRQTCRTGTGAQAIV
jgi:hypothetical protein